LRGLKYISPDYFEYRKQQRRFAAPILIRGEGIGYLHVLETQELPTKKKSRQQAGLLLVKYFA
jgi:hypothetical protein